jgi:hypothetical protein
MTNEYMLLIGAASIVVNASVYFFLYCLGYSHGRKHKAEEITPEERRQIADARWRTEERRRCSDVGRHLEIIEQINRELAEKNSAYRNARYNQLAYGDPMPSP